MDAIEKRQAAVETKALTFMRLFATPDGQAVLRYLEEDTIHKSSLPGQAPDGSFVAIELARREGENEMVRKIKRLMQKGEEHARRIANQ